MSKFQVGDQVIIYNDNGLSVYGNIVKEGEVLGMWRIRSYGGGYFYRHESNIKKIEEDKVEYIKAGDRVKVWKDDSTPVYGTLKYFESEKWKVLLDDGTHLYREDKDIVKVEEAPVSNRFKVGDYVMYSDYQGNGHYYSYGTVVSISEFAGVPEYTIKPEKGGLNTYRKDMNGEMHALSTKPKEVPKVQYELGDIVRITSGNNTLEGEVTSLTTVQFNLKLSTGQYFFTDPLKWTVEVLKKKVTLPTKERALIYVAGAHYLRLGGLWYTVGVDNATAPDVMQEKVQKSSTYKVIFGGEE